MAQDEDELDHLLDAFAADSLTPEERRQLHGAAMRDQRLLCALADEQALREVLRDPVLRARLLLELRTAGGAWRNATRWWRQPWTWIAVGSAVSVVATILIGTELYQDRTPEQPPRVEREDSAPTSSAVATPPAESKPVTPVPNDDVTSPPAPFNKPDADRSVPRRIPAPFTEPLVEERVRDDEISAPPAGLRKQDPERPAPKKSDSVVRSKPKPPAVLEPGQNASQTVHDDAIPAPPAELASPAQQQASLPTPSAQRIPAPPVSSARTLFYGKPNHVASAAALRSRESDHTGGLDTEHEPFIPSALPAPLAIRYSLVIAGPDGTDQEVDVETPVSLSDRPRLAVQTNQDGYLLVTDMPSTAEMAHHSAGGVQTRPCAHDRDISLGRVDHRPGGQPGSPPAPSLYDPAARSQTSADPDGRICTGRAGTACSGRTGRARRLCRRPRSLRTAYRRIESEPAPLACTVGRYHPVSEADLRQAIGQTSSDLPPFPATSKRAAGCGFSL